MGRDQSKIIINKFFFRDASLTLFSIVKLGHNEIILLIKER